eukprot:8361697-Alexandrium_andersonii.AAC.1
MAPAGCVLARPDAAAPPLGQLVGLPHSGGPLGGGARRRPSPQIPEAHGLRHSLSSDPRLPLQA